ncbi:MAG TPA: signal peptidase I [Thermoflexales bacterium]|jgi:signal peptidase I|nr:signal peptidase I [Anaerolineae bacterium]HQV26578.1 signal peptidase I [Thermoflexales bacterium]HQX08825.1 signal peptidase I [Thermoflexales bacterium]HQY23697.1 signal peptidase I [Thermoflexales bacterium]HQZ51961.1 signal peptidase I [Thermoflexales bacterium]
MSFLPALPDEETAEAGVVDAVSRPARSLWVTALEIVLAVLILTGISQSLFANFEVGDEGMRPGITPDQQIAVSRISYLLAPPQRGDLVAVRIPTNPSRSAARRIVGLPGERIDLRGTQLFVDGQPLSEPYLPSAFIGAGTPVSLTIEVNLSADQYFVLSDNRAFFVDSRVWGAVGSDAIVGRVWFSYWPSDRLGFIRRSQAP